MKKITGTLILSSLLLFGCSNNLANINTANKETEETTKTDYLSDYASNPQVTDDRKLIKKGQSITDDKGEATLKSIKNINKTYEMGPIKLTIKDVKVVHLVPSYSLIDYYHALTHDEEFDFVKVFVEIENTSVDKVNFAPIAMFETNTGEKFDWSRDIYLEELNGEYEGNSLKKGNLGFIIDSSKEVEWIEILTSDVFDKDEKQTYKSQKIKIKF